MVGLVPPIHVLTHRGRCSRRHARHKGYTGEIIVAGEFALDQANYFVKSGADAFVVADDQVATLSKTLTDLATGHNGESVNRLPLFS